MKKIITFGILLLTFISSIWVFSIYVEETTITLKPWLNSVSTPGLLKWISFSNWGDNISFATLVNQKRSAVSIKNDNVWQVFSPLTGFIVRNDTLEDVIMTLSYETDIDNTNTFFEKVLNKWWNLLWITNTSNKFDNFENASATTVLDLTNWGDSNKVIESNSFQETSKPKLWKAYWVFVDEETDWSWVYSWENNNTKLSWRTESECQEMCWEDENSCPDECKSWILANNTVKNPRIKPNGDQKVIYNGSFTANKYIQIKWIQINWDNTIPKWDKLQLYVYVKNSKKPAITLDKNTYTRNPTRSNTVTVNTGDTIALRIEAKYSWTTENLNYNIEFKLSWSPVPFYTNSQRISLIVTWLDNTPEIPDTPEIPEDPISPEFLKAYNWANSKWILNNQIITYETLNSGINNTELALFMNNYAKNILNHTTDTSKDCSFVDSQNDAILEACQLWLIKNGDNINFNDQSTLSIFWLLLSRTLWNDRYNWWNHLNAIKIAWIVKDTTTPEINPLKWDILVALMNSEWKNEYRRVENSYNFSMNDFNAVEDIYQNIRTSEWDRVIYIVRHSARVNNCTSEGWLTDTGIELARWVWEKLKWVPFEDTSTDFYGSSTVKRTVQTSYYVWESRGSEVLENIIDNDLRNEYNFVNHSQNINNIVYWNYFSDGTRYSSIEHLYEENKNTTNERSINAINKLCNMTDWHPFSRITSHDWYTLPITEWATNENITFHTSNRDRPNFMQWVAVIVHSYWWWEVYPVKSLETGKIDKSLNPSC